MHYSMVIQWSDEDQAYVVIFPEWDSIPKTHGDTYEAAAKNGKIALKQLIESRKAHHQALPAPRVYA